jgi:hypothetical protein
MRMVFGEETPEFGVGFDNIGNPLCGIESGNLDDVFLCRPSQLRHSQGVTLFVVEMSVITLIPFIQVFVESIKPVRSCWEIGNLRSRHITRNEGGDWMTDEHIRMLDIAPKELPNIGLRGAFCHGQVAPNLNVTSIQNRPIWSNALDQGDQTRHLRIINLI